jgi:hypothetical protein
MNTLSFYYIDVKEVILCTDLEFGEEIQTGERKVVQMAQTFWSHLRYDFK